MKPQDGQLIVVDWLCRPLGEPVAQRRSPNGWTSAIRSGGGADADRSTIRFRKSLRTAVAEIHAVEFMTERGEGRTSVIGLKRDSEGSWRVIGSAGGGSSDPPGDRPWLNLGAWGWPDHGFWGGGRIVGFGHDSAARIQLRFANGVSLDDTVTDRYALFMTQELVQLPVRVDVLDATGHVLNSHIWPTAKSRG